MKKNLFLILITLTLLISCIDDEETKPDVLYNLDNHAISALVIDNSNTLWIGTDTGLFRSVINGYELVEIKNDSPVSALGFDEASNTLWVGTIDGLSKLTLSGNTIAAESISTDKLSNKRINSVYIDSNSENWFGADSGITRNSLSIWQKEKFKKNANGSISAAPFEKIGVNSIASWDGDYYFATNGRSVYRSTGWDPSVDAFTGASQLLNPYNGFALTDTMYVVFIDSKGQQWMGGRDGVQVHEGHDPKELTTSFYDELVNPVVHCIAEAPDGKIWVGTENGISIYDGNNWTSSSLILPDNFVTAIVFETSGKKWIGTKKGLFGIN